MAFSPPLYSPPYSSVSWTTCERRMGEAWVRAWDALNTEIDPEFTVDVIYLDQSACVLLTRTPSASLPHPHPLSTHGQHTHASQYARRGRPSYSSGVLNTTTQPCCSKKISLHRCVWRGLCVCVCVCEYVCVWQCVCVCMFGSLSLPLHHSLTHTHSPTCSFT